MQISVLVSFGVAIIAAAGFMACVVALFAAKMDVSMGKWIVAMILLVFFCIVALLTSSSVHTEGIVKVLTFWELPLLFMAARQTGVNSIRKLIYGVNLCYPIMFLLFYNSSFAYRYFSEYGVTLSEHVTLGYSNPNETGLYLMICLFILASAFFYYKRLEIRICCAAEIVCLGFLIWKTQCRVAMMLSLAVLVLTVFCKRVCIRKPLWNTILLFPAIYIVLLLIWPELTELRIWGETLDTGRSTIYQEAIRNLTLSGFFFGAYGRYHLANMHNAYLSIFASLGIFAAASYMAILRMAYKKCCNVVLEKKENIVLLLGMLATLVVGAVEAALFVGGSVYAASVFLLYHLFISNDEMK